MQQKLETRAGVPVLLPPDAVAMARLVEEFEQQFSKPVVSFNVACWWATLRAAGITDQLAGYGQLMREH
jgi:maleate cis-trans isomerase